MMRALTRFDPYTTLVVALGYTIATGLGFGYITASEATGALTVYLGSGVLMAPAIALALIARRGDQRIRRTMRLALVKLGVTPADELERAATESETPADELNEIFGQLGREETQLRDVRACFDELESWLGRAIDEAEHRSGALPPGLPPQVVSDEVVALLEQRIATLQDRTVLLLTLRGGLSDEQIAAELGLPVDRVHQLRARTIRKMSEREGRPGSGTAWRRKGL